VVSPIVCLHFLIEQIDSRAIVIDHAPKAVQKALHAARLSRCHASGRREVVHGPSNRL